MNHELELLYSALVEEPRPERPTLGLLAERAVEYARTQPDGVRFVDLFDELRRYEHSERRRSLAISQATDEGGLYRDEVGAYRAAEAI